MTNTSPFTVVDQFEAEVAAYAGSKYAVAVDCCTNAIFLCLKYINKPQTITIPKKTYISVPSSIIHAGYGVQFEDITWSGVYQLNPLPIFDGAARFKRGMYQGGYHCLSFHIKKHIKIGKGGMILTDDREAYDWLRLARFNGRNPVPHDIDNFNMVGWNYYMTGLDAARGLWLLACGEQEYSDLPMENYPDLSIYNLDRARSGDKLYTL